MARRRTTRPLRLMVASTVYQFEDQLRQVCATLKGFGYEVWNSYIGTIRVEPGRSNRANCLAAVEECDLFLGIIRPFYGSGVIGERSITHDEIRRAIALDKPRWFLVHENVRFARLLLRPLMFDERGSRTAFVLPRTPVMDDLRVIEMYDDAIRSDLPPADRVTHWAQGFYRLDEALDYIENQFRDVDRARQVCRRMGAP